MKLRIRGNSVRIRVTRGETALLGAGEKVEQTTEFGGGERLISSVELSSQAASVTAEFSSNSIA